MLEQLIKSTGALECTDRRPGDRGGADPGKWLILEGSKPWELHFQHNLIKIYTVQIDVDYASKFASD